MAIYPMLKSTAALAFIFIILVGSFPFEVAASSFLRHMPQREFSPQLERSLLVEMNKSLGRSSSTEKRFEGIKKALTTMFTVLPKNEQGKLSHASASYALYRIFFQRHNWFIVGLEPWKSMIAWNNSSPVAMSQDDVPNYIKELFHNRTGKEGFGLHELAVLIAAFEHLIHRESLQRLTATYKALDVDIKDVLSEDDVPEILDTYMAIYILGPLVQNLSSVAPEYVQTLRTNVTQLYPGFSQIQELIREMQESVSVSRDYLYFSDLAMLAEEMTDRYSRWQDYECRDIKDSLVAMEDNSSEGRVPLKDFHQAAKSEGKWQLHESVEYLRDLGALDESDLDNLRVIIPNYVNSRTNCVAASGFYSVCCINECEELLTHLEDRVKSVEATPKELLDIVTMLPSSTVKANRTFSNWQLRLLDEAAASHGGRVPIHGRLFAQWLHYAYPRECPYPDVSGSSKAAKDPRNSSHVQRDPEINPGEMMKIIEEASNRSATVSSQSSWSSSRAFWSSKEKDVLMIENFNCTMQEGSIILHPTRHHSPLKEMFRGLVLVLVLVSAFAVLGRNCGRGIAAAVGQRRAQRKKGE